MHFLIRLLILAVLCLGGAASAFALPTVSLTSSGNGVFVLNASGLRSIGGIQVILSYDTATLANPRVSKGPLASSAMMDLNTRTPGRIIMPLVHPTGFAESGVIATINFDLIGSAPGIVPSLQVTMADVNSGASVRSQTINPFSTAQATVSSAGSTPEGSTPDPAATTTATETLTSTETITTGSKPSSRSTGTGGGAVSDAAPSAPAEEPAAATAETPAETTQETARLTSETAAADAPGSGPRATETQTTASATPDDAAQPLERLVREEEKLPAPTGYQSVLEQLRGFTGPKTAKSLTEIFSRHSTPGVRQEPAIGLTDGSSRLRLLVTPRSAGSHAPNFSLSGAMLVALKPEPDGSWVLEVLPAKGSYSATLTILQGKAETVVPLVVAPPLAGGDQPKLTESGFAQFLNERGTEKSPRFDLNGDGRRDYIDDYIFTANYLARKESGSRTDHGRKGLTVGGSGSPGREGTGKAK